MKRDLRKQTYSKPVKPDDDEIKRLTSDEGETTPPPPQKKDEPPLAKEEPPVVIKEPEEPVTNKNTTSENIKPKRQQKAGSRSENINPFLLSRGQSSEIGIEKTGYRLRSDYMDLLKLVKRMKKGYTLEAVLDEVLTYYFENSDDGRKAVKQRAILDID